MSRNGSPSFRPLADSLLAHAEFLSDLFLRGTTVEPFPYRRPIRLDVCYHRRTRPYFGDNPPILRENI